MKNYSAKYIQYGSELDDCTSEEEVRKHNQAMRELSKLFHQVKDEQDKSFLLELLKHPNSRVRRIAAAHCLGMHVYEIRALLALRKIIRKGENRHDVFTAKLTLEWRKQGHKLTC